MRTRLLPLSLDPASRTPITLQIVEGLKRAIREGHLRPGDPLPSTRALAETLRVSRNTVMDAYEELAAEGMVVGRRGSGSYVAESAAPQTTDSECASKGDRLAFPLASPPPAEELPATLLACQTGQADPRLLPVVALARAYRKALEARAVAAPRHRDALSSAQLRSHLLQLLEHTAGLGGSADNLFLTSGIHTALQLVARTLLAPGDRVAVEALGSKPHWDLLRQAGAIPLPVPVDQEGLSIEALERLAEGGPLRAVLLTPRCQYPTTIPLSKERRRALLAWARHKGVALLEVDTESGITYGPHPPVALAAEDVAGCVIYLGSFAKSLFPGVPLAYIHAPTPLIAHFRTGHHPLDPAADPVFQGAMTGLFVEGEFHRHLARLRTAFLQRRDALAEALRRELGSALTFDLPKSGLALWARVDPDLDVEAWSERAIRQGVAFTVGRRYSFDDTPVPALRLGFASHQEGELEEIVRRMAAAR